MAKLDDKSGVSRKVGTPYDKSGVSRKVGTPYFTPECLNISAVRKTLDDMESTGNASRLYYCFKWVTSPQGMEYWHDIANGTTVIDREGLNYLHWLLEQET